MRHLLHILASIAMWCLFGYYWFVVLGRDIAEGTIRSVLVLVAVILAGLGITVLWIRHNQRLARKFAGRRRQPTAVGAPELAHDTIGRPIRAPGLASLRAARVVEVTADRDGKAFRVADGEPLP